MRQRTINSNLKITLLLSLYYILLMWIYNSLIAPRFSYTGLVVEANNDGIYLSILGVVFTIFTFIIIHKKDQPSSLIMNLFNLLFYIPMYVFVAYKNTVSGFFLFLILYQFALFFFYIFIPFSFKPYLKRSKKNFFRIVFFILITTLLINGIYNGFQIKIDLSDVYENRLAKRDMSIPSIFNYIKAASYFVGIITLMYALKIKNWAMVAFVVLIQLMSFAFGASKTQFFSIFVCFIAFYFYSNRMRLWAPISLLALLVISVLEFKIYNSTEITDIWTRRSLFVPPKISYTMYEFFEMPDREFLYLKGSLFRFLGFEDPYASNEGFQRMIGAIYGSEDTNANTGLLGNDYAQLGWWSLIIFPFIRIYILKMYDYCAIGIDKRIMVVLSIFIAFTYISGAFFTVLVTNGILLVNYLLYCFPREKSK